MTPFIALVVVLIGIFALTIFYPGVMFLMCMGLTVLGVGLSQSRHAQIVEVIGSVLFFSGAMGMFVSAIAFLASYVK